MIRGDIGRVLLHQASYNPANVPLSVISAYRSALKVDKWDGLIEITNVEEPNKQARAHNLFIISIL